MVERQASEPAIVGVMSKIERRADGVPPLHAIGDDRAFGWPDVPEVYMMACGAPRSMRVRRGTFFSGNSLITASPLYEIVASVPVDS